MFRHILNGQQVSEPIDWASFSGELVRDFTTRTISQQYPSSATFGGGGYDILRGFFLSGLCNIVDYQVDENCGGQWVTVMRSRIIVSDLVFNLNRCTVQASLVDDGIGARIANNRRIPIRYTSERTKNRDVQPPVVEQSITFFDPVDGSAIGARRVIDWLRAVTHAVRYITDDNVQVQSAWYNDLPPDELYAITTGYQIRTGDIGFRALYMEYSFEELFTELAKKYDLWLYVTRDSAGGPVVNVEPYGTTVLPDVAIEHPAVEVLQQDIDTDQLYASVAVGSESGLPNLDAVQSLPFLILVGHSRERFHFEGVCNTDRELDLVNRWGIDTNLIERTLAGNTDADDDIFLVQYGGGVATQGNDFTSSFQYNPALLNFRVLGRYRLPAAISVATADPDSLIGEVRQDLVLPLPVGNISAAPAGPLQTFIAPSAQANFSAVVSDPGSNFQLNPGRYTAPVQGFYSFAFAYRFVLSLVQFQHAAIVPFIRWTRYDSANNPVPPEVDVNALSSALVIGGPGPVVSGPVEGPFNALSIYSAVLNPGDYIEARFGWRIVALSGATVQQIVLPQLVPDGYSFAATGVAPGGGVIDVNPDLAPIVRYQWDRHIPAQQWAALMDDPRLAIVVGPTQTDLRTGHALRISRNMGTGNAQLTILTDLTQPL